MHNEDTMLDLLINSSIVHSALMIVPASVALLLRWARCPGWPVVGGAIAGILLGPTLFGRMAPEAFEAHFIGGVEERIVLDDLRHECERDLVVAQAAGVGVEARDAIELRYESDIAAAETALDKARWKFQRPIRTYGSALIVLALLGAGMLRVRREPNGRESAGDTPGAGGLITPMSIGLWSSVLPGALAYAAMVWWWDFSPAQAGLTAAAVAIGPWLLTGIDRTAADEAERGGARLMQTAGWIASIVAIGAAGAALAGQHGGAGLMWAAPLLALPIGWLLPAIRKERVVRVILDFFLVPGITACLAIHIEFIEHTTLWPLLVIVLIGGDGRWLGAFLGAMILGGRNGLRTMRLVIGSMACGPTQIAVATIAAHSWGLPDSIPPALLIGAVLIEVTRPARRALARRIVETEEIIEADEA